MDSSMPRGTIKKIDHDGSRLFYDDIIHLHGSKGQ